MKLATPPPPEPEPERLSCLKLHQFAPRILIEHKTKMIKKLSKHGNSWALVIDKAILDLLSWEEEQKVELTTDGKNLFIKPPPKEEIARVRTTGTLDHSKFPSFVTLGDLKYENRD